VRRITLRLFGRSKSTLAVLLILQVKSTELLSASYSAKHNTSGSLSKLPEFVTERISNWLNSYAKSFNNKYRRSGAVFKNYSKREWIATQSHLLMKMKHLHLKPELCGIVEQFNHWPYSSFHRFCDGNLNAKQTKILTQIGGLERLIDFHFQEDPILLSTLTRTPFIKAAKSLGD
jgi:hypothetical protein